MEFIYELVGSAVGGFIAYFLLVHGGWWLGRMRDKIICGLEQMRKERQNLGQ